MTITAAILAKTFCKRFCNMRTCQILLRPPLLFVSGFGASNDAPVDPAFGSSPRSSQQRAFLFGCISLYQRTHPAGQLSRSVAKRGRTDRSRKSRTTWTSGSCAGASRDSRDASADQDPSVSRACDTAVAGLRETRNALRTETNLVTNGLTLTIPKNCQPPKCCDRSFSLPTLSGRERMRFAG